MDPLQAIVLAVVQGLSEFLPISSSGHLVLVPHFFGWPDQGLAFDVAVHVGTLFAVLTYFRRELVAMIRAPGFGSLAGRGLDARRRLAWQLLLGTIPVGLVGLAFGGLIEEHLRHPLSVATTLAFFGALMWLADRFGRRERDEYSVGWRDAILIGCAQALALMPGTSRSGITMTMARALGLTREGAARFSFLLAVPGIGDGGRLRGARSSRRSERRVDWRRWSPRHGVRRGVGYRLHRLPDPLHRAHRPAPFTIYRSLVAGARVRGCSPDQACWLSSAASRRRAAAARRSSSPASALAVARPSSATAVGDGLRRAQQVQPADRARSRRSGPRPRVSASQATSSSRKRSGRRNASQDSSSSSIVRGRSSAARWTLPCQRAASTASSR